MTLRQPDCDALILAADASAMEVGERLQVRGGGVWVATVVGHPGEALKQVLRCRPKVLFVCATTDRLDAAATLIAALRLRRSGDALPFVALAAGHDEAIERAVRVAGVTHYLTLDSPADADLLDRLLRQAGIPPPDVGVVPTGLSPPRGLPPPGRHCRRHRPSRS